EVLHRPGQPCDSGRNRPVHGVVVAVMLDMLVSTEFFCGQRPLRLRSRFRPLVVKPHSFHMLSVATEYATLSAVPRAWYRVLPAGVRRTPGPRRRPPTRS